MQPIGSFSARVEDFTLIQGPLAPTTPGEAVQQLLLDAVHQSNKTAFINLIKQHPGLLSPELKYSGDPLVFKLIYSWNQKREEQGIMDCTCQLLGFVVQQKPALVHLKDWRDTGFLKYAVEQQAWQAVLTVHQIVPMEQFTECLKELDIQAIWYGLTDMNLPQTQRDRIHQVLDILLPLLKDRLNSNEPGELSTLPEAFVNPEVFKKILAQMDPEHARRILLDKKAECSNAETLEIIEKFLG